MNNLFNYLQQYASKYKTGITSAGAKMQSAFGIDMDTDGTMGSDVVSEQYGKTSFLRKRKDISLPPPRMLTTPTTDMVGDEKRTRRTSSKIDWTNQRPDDNIDGDNHADEDDYSSLFPNLYQLRGITAEHERKERY